MFLTIEHALGIFSAYALNANISDDCGFIYFLNNHYTLSIEV